jgi:hypothetical protein
VLKIEQVITEYSLVSLAFWAGLDLIAVTVGCILRFEHLKRAMSAGI